MSSVEQENWHVAKSYDVKLIVDLPRDVQFERDVTLTVNYARQWEVTSYLVEMMQLAGERGDNFGVDELEGPLLEFATEYSTIFTARWSNVEKSTGDIAAFIVIGPSLFSNTIDPSLADIHIFRTRDIPDVTYVGLVELSLELAKQLDVGFMECILSVSVSCDSLINELVSRLQFEVAVTLPQSVNMANGVGLVDSKVLVKNITPRDCCRQPRTTDQVLSMLSKYDSSDAAEDDNEFNNATLPAIPMLPQHYYAPDADLDIIIRNVRKEDDKLLFRMMNSSAELGEGISLHDLPSLKLFRRYMLVEAVCIVFEHPVSGAVVGFYVVCPCPVVRSQLSRCCEGTLVIAKEYQSRGLSLALVEPIHALIQSVGYTCAINSYYANNVRSQRSSGRFATILGVIPRAAHVINAGWQNQVMVHIDMSNSSTFERVMDDNKRTRQLLKDKASSSKL